jgi:hypothetical protein
MKIAFTDKLKSLMNSGSCCYNAVQNLLSSRLVSKDVKISRYGLLDIIRMIK